MSHSQLSNALKKARKHVKRIFTDPTDSGLIQDLYAVLYHPDLKNSIILDEYLSNKSASPTRDGGMWEATETVLEECYQSRLPPGDDFEHQILELIDIFKRPSYRCFAEAHSEITSRRYYVPDVTAPSFAMMGTYGTLASLNRLGTASAQALNGASTMMINGNLSTNTLNEKNATTGQKKKGMTLTGGGTGPRLKPIEGSVKMISIDKKKGEDLAFSVALEEYESPNYGMVKEVVVKRIMVGSKIEQQDLLHVGDVIREINSFPINSPEVLQDRLKEASGSVTLKVIPAFMNKRAHSNDDTLIPCKEGGLKFANGDVLQVLDQTDTYWWQARHHGSKGRAGIIPSELLEERRLAHRESARDPDKISYALLGLRSGSSGGHRKKEVHIEYTAKNADDFESKDIILYEEVALISGFQRPVVCLLGASGVGRRTLRDMLIQSNPMRYAAAIPYTSRPKMIDEVPGEQYYFDTRTHMEQQFKQNNFIEYGEYGGYLYGTKYETVRNAIASGRTCLVDCHPKSVRVLRNSEFMPYVVFIAAPKHSCMKAMYEYGRMMNRTRKLKSDDDLHATLEQSMSLERTYTHLFDWILLNDNLENSYDLLCQKLDSLLTESQWVPAKWLY